MITYPIKLCFVLVCFACLIQCGEVIRLDSTNFATLTSEGRWFVKFFAPWCGHCQQLEPVWKTVAARTNFDKVKIAEVDCTANALLCGRQKIVGYPMMKWFDGGEPRDYKGAREVQAILDWIEGGAKSTLVATGAGAPLGEVITLTKENFDQVLEGLWMVNFYANWCTHSKKFEPIWQELAQHAEGYKVASIDVGTEYELSKKYDVHGTPSVLMFKDGYHFRVTGPRSVDFLDRFVRSEGLGQPFDPYTTKKKDDKKEGSFSNVVDLTENFDKAMVGNELFTLFYAPWCSHCKKAFPIWEDIANRYVGKGITIAKVDGTKNHPLMERYKVRGYPTFLYTTSKGDEHQYTGPRDFASFDQYIFDMMNKE